MSHYKLLLLLPEGACGAPFELASQRRLGADRWVSTRKFVSHECWDFVGEVFSSIETVEALKAPPALGPFSTIVGSWPNSLCCSIGDRVAVDAEVEPSLLCLTGWLAARQKRK